MGAYGLRLSAFLVVAASLSACTTVNAPVLRHQTGETLGTKHFRAFAFYEMSRLFEPASTTETLGIGQGNSVFQSSRFGAQAEGGVLPQLDLQLGVNFTGGGGGWKIGAKYQIFKTARLAVAGMIGYAASSGSGPVTYMTVAQPVDIAQTLSSHTFDLSVPVSYRITPNYVAYSGIMWLQSSVSGSLGSVVVTDTSHDPGANLGMRAEYGMFTGDFEIAYLMVHDPFSDSSRLIPYLGGSLGVKF